MRKYSASAACSKRAAIPRMRPVILRSPLVEIVTTISPSRSQHIQSFGCVKEYLLPGMMGGHRDCEQMKVRNVTISLQANAGVQVESNHLRRSTDRNRKCPNASQHGLPQLKVERTYESSVGGHLPVRHRPMRCQASALSRHRQDSRGHSRRRSYAEIVIN